MCSRAGQDRDTQPLPGQDTLWGSGQASGLHVQTYVWSKEKTDRFRTCFDSVSLLYEMYEGLT